MRKPHLLVTIILVLLLIGGSALAQGGASTIYLPLLALPSTAEPVPATPTPVTPVPATPTPVTPTPVTPVPLPDPVTALDIGTTTGGNPCRVTDPRPQPVTLPAGSTSFAFQLTRRIPSTSDIGVGISPGFGGGVRSTSCNDYIINNGQVVQNRLGAQIERLDGSPLPSGSYRLRIRVGSTITEIPFTIE